MAVEDDDSEYAAQMEIARYLRRLYRKAQRAHLPRYQGRARIKNRISLYVPPGNPKRVEFKVSLDIVEAWYNWQLHRMGPQPPVPESLLRGLHVDIACFPRKAVPMLLMRLREPFSKPPGRRLSRGDKSWVFLATAEPKSLNIDATGGSIAQLEIIPWPARKGHLVILPDTHRLYNRKRDDPYELISAWVDPNEPPRFRGGVRDPNYHPERNTENE